MDSRQQYRQIGDWSLENGRLTEILTPVVAEQVGVTDLHRGEDRWLIVRIPARFSGMISVSFSSPLFFRMKYWYVQGGVRKSSALFKAGQKLPHLRRLHRYRSTCQSQRYLKISLNDQLVGDEVERVNTLKITIQVPITTESAPSS